MDVKAVHQTLMVPKTGQTPLSIILCNTIFKVSICLVTDEVLSKERILFEKLNELHLMHCIKERALNVALLQMQSMFK